MRTSPGLTWTALEANGTRYGLQRGTRADVYGTLMLGGGGESVWVETEAGLGVHNSRGNGRLEQQDPFLYSAFLRARSGPVAARVGLIGHVFWTNDWSARGNENMGELRAGVRVGAPTRPTAMNACLAAPVPGC